MKIICEVPWHVWKAEAFSPTAFVVRAAIITVLFSGSELLGLKEYTTFLSGTSTNLNMSWQTAATLGLIHLLLYIGFILFVPISLITAGLLIAWKRWIGGRPANTDSLNLEPVETVGRGELKPSGKLPGNSRHSCLGSLLIRRYESRMRISRVSNLAGAVLALFGSLNCFAAGGLAEVQVFQSGTEGYHTFRIPAIVRATNGTLLAFAEGRKKGASDTGDIDLVLKRSLDHGHTWGTLQVIGDDGPNTCGNPVPIVDVTTGRVVLLTTHNAGNVTEQQVLTGAVRDRRVFVQTSADNGATWSKAREITDQVKRGDWRGYATGPGHGIQLTRGPHAGRLIAACDHTTSNSTNWSACGAHLLDSDDGGNTWQIGSEDSPGNGLINPNESTAVELAEGHICTLARNQEGHADGHRVFAYSRDGGTTFDAPFAIVPGLVSPVVEASLLRYSAMDEGGKTNRILLSAPGDASVRKNMTVRSSFNETKTWNAGKIIYAGPAAYSDLVELPGGRIGLLYESGVQQPYERITFAVFGVDFLDGTEGP
jgi:sialidase-1